MVEEDRRDAGTVADGAFDDESGTVLTPAGSERSRMHATSSAQRVLPERYEDRGHVGRGGSGEVRRVYDRRVERELVIKILGWEHLDPPRNPTYRRFQNEARVTAALEHPGVVPVHDRGALADGRLWFTMKEVRGETFDEVIDALHRAPPAERSARRRTLVEALLRVAETVGYAHSRGVVHRDLKPENLMCGAFGEVYVMDWGIARAMAAPAPDETPVPAGGQPRIEDGDRALTRSGEIFGTIHYMAPEQARGHTEAVGPASDVWALALVLHEILVGRVAFPGPGLKAWADIAGGKRPRLPADARVPSELRELFDAATEVAPSERLPDGRAFAERLRAWLAGEARRDRAAAVLREVDARQERLARLRDEEARLRADAQALLGTLRDDSPDEARLPAWRAEDLANTQRDALEEAEAELLELLRAALQHDPESEGAHARIATLARSEVVAAEQRGDAREAWRWERLLKQHDTGRHAAFLAGLGTLKLAVDPPDARAAVLRYEEVDRRLEPRTFRGNLSPPFEIALPAGSYLVLLEAEGRETVRYPVRIEREATWDTTPPDGSAPRRVWLPPAGTLDEGECFVPAGWSVVGAPGGASDAYPRTKVWLEGFVIRRDPVTVAEYVAFLEDLLTSGKPAEAASMVPASGTDRTYVRVDAGRVIVAPVDNSPDPEAGLRAPIRWVTFAQAEAYARWLGERASKPWRVPTDVEWEKAGRGADERRYPWGATPVASWVVARGHAPHGLRPVDEPTRDESPYGVRHLAGCVRELCATPWRLRPVLDARGAVSTYDPRETRAFQSVRGGSYLGPIDVEMLAARYAIPPNEPLRSVGFRLCRSLPKALRE
ncbi:MAG: bifunctional serine/threonine-protein kinase/formylglycine-generating enzyme family protein [Myxococcota bacterium]